MFKFEDDSGDMTLAKDICAVLDRHYPGYRWAVNVNSEGGVVDILNTNISSTYGYRLMLKDVYADPGRRLVILGAGEFLERARLKRGRRTEDETTILEGERADHGRLRKQGIIF